MGYVYKGYEVNKEIKRKAYIRKGKSDFFNTCYICADTETSWNHDILNPVCWVYQWAFTFDKGLYFGRTPTEFTDKLAEICEIQKTDSEHKLICFFHNLPYDFSYLVLFLKEKFGNPVKILAHAPRKPFAVEYENGLVLRCSYKLSNDSLDRWAKKLDTKHRKLVGLIDYEKVRTQTDLLYKKDWLYLFRDVIVLDECIAKQLALYSDTIVTMPLTSTGYIRRVLKKKFDTHEKGKENKNRHLFKDSALNTTTYTAHNMEFAGGISQGNINMRGKKQVGCMRHRDFDSHYPSNLRAEKYSRDKYALFTEATTIEDLQPYKEEYSILCEVYIQDLYLKSNEITLPYLQKSHVLRYISEGFRYLDNNGRMVAFQGISKVYLYIEEVEIVRSQYNGKILINKTYASIVDFLPKWFSDTIDDSYIGKNSLKEEIEYMESEGVSRDIIFNKKTDLMKKKNLLNGMFGVAATNPVRVEYTLDGNEWKTEKTNAEDIEMKLNKFYKSRNSFMRFQWGTECTKNARVELMEFVECIGYENFIYSDTDSIFYYSTPEIEKRIEELNEKKKQRALKNNAFVTLPNGKIKNYDRFALENEEIKEFKFLHSKCYAYVTADDKLHCTIAGVVAKNGKTYREDELKTIDNLHSKFVFTKCGGTKAKYLDSDIIDYENNITCGGCIITKTTKTLKEDDYSEREEIFYAEL